MPYLPRVSQWLYVAHMRWVYAKMCDHGIMIRVTSEKGRHFAFSVTSVIDNAHRTLIVLLFSLR